MPSFRYAGNELRRRASRTVLTALGLAAGVGLVMGIVGVSAGLDRAQQQVLSPLGSVGTDILVTRTVAATGTAATGTAATGTAATPTPSATPTPAAGQGGAGGFFAGGGGPGGRNGGGAAALASLDDADATALLNENSSVITDLSKLGKAGTKFTHDFFLAGTLITFPQQAVDTVASVPGVTSVTPALTLQAQHQTGTVPNIVAEVKTGGETLTSTTRPAPLTSSEQAAFRSCIVANGGFGDAPGPAPSPGTRPGGGQGGGGGFGATQKCLPKRFQEYQTNVVTPLRTIQQIVNPPATDTTSSSYTAAGVDPASVSTGLITKANLSSGSWFSSDVVTNSGQVLVSTAYATKQKISVGDKLPINGTSYAVVGLVNPTLTGNTADVYFTLAQLQKNATKTGRVNEVLVKVGNASQVDAVAAAIKKALPGAQVVTGKDVADTVTGSLQNARDLASRLGGALAVIVLLAAFVIAVLLTLSSVAKRVREIGTLRALGWSKGRVVGQIVTETTGIGLLGGALGVGLGYLASIAVAQFSPQLTATTQGVAAGASTVSSLFGQVGGQAVTRNVQLTAPITAGTIALGMACALMGGLLAGTIGGWRAARLSPAVALRDLG
jgi:ABC-type antimicrobial peptide transport system permease subunit